MGGWRGFVGIALAPGARLEATWSPSKGGKRGAGPVQKKRYLCNRDGGLPGGSQPGRAAEGIKERLNDGEMDAQTSSPRPAHLEGYASSRLAGSTTEIA